MIDIQKLKSYMNIELTDVTATDIRKCVDYLHSRGYLGGVPEKNIKTFDAWFVFDGDVNGLAEFCDALNWNSFKKGGRDKKGNFVIFLVDGDESIGAIRSRSNKLHITALDYLMGYTAPKGETK